MRILKSIVNYNNKNSLGNKFRQRRFEFFENAIKNYPKPLKILDIGGTEQFWKNRGFANNPDFSIMLVNLYKEEPSSENINSEIGNAVDLSQFEDYSFDIVFSNSVIEHLFDLESQGKMASEVQRLGKYHFIQTPNKYFPIEPHFLFPLFQFLPKSFKMFLLTKTKLIRGVKHDYKYSKSKIDEIKLLSGQQLKKMFPSSFLFKEKFFGFVKSFVVHNL